MLNLRQEDALMEYMSVFIGQSASLLSEMVDKKIEITIPKILLLAPDSDKEEYNELKPAFFNSHVVTSSIEFGKIFSGVARLVFPKDSAQKLVCLCMGEEYEGISDGNLTDTDHDAIKEIGNVLLNSLLGCLGNLLEIKMDYSIPKVHIYFFPEEEEDIFDNNAHILIICNSFTIADVCIEGAVIIVFNVESCTELISKIDEVLVEAYG
ncbi:MAG: chemotaxis protein CheC [Peptococcaceae bacterium]|nr:chemotaxis protein CheC [Peptococcaceae bacterium]